VISDNAVFSHLAPSIAWLAVSLAASATLAVVVERALQGLRQVRQRRLEQRYMPIVRRALVGDAAAERALVDCPRRDRIDVAVLLVTPLIDDRDSWRIARTREIFEEMKWHKIGGSGFRHLSMGMSNDYEIAVEEGSTLVRLGTVLFGARER